MFTRVAVRDKMISEAPCGTRFAWKFLRTDDMLECLPDLRCCMLRERFFVRNFSTWFL